LRRLLLLLLCVQLAYGGSIQISNLGHTGFLQTNQEYTSSTTVNLNMVFTAATSRCRYINWDSTLPLPTSPWSAWEPCVSQKYWVLDNPDGNKTVYAEIDYVAIPDVIVNDSISYNSTGAGLDITPPGTVQITDGDFTNQNASIPFSWTPSADFESVSILSLPILYNVSFIRDRSGMNTTILSIVTRSTAYSLTAQLRHGDRVYVNVTAINSGSLRNTSVSDGLRIDQASPFVPIMIENAFYNRTTGAYEEANQTYWYDADSLRFRWDATDAMSGIAGYSYVITSGNESADTVMEEGSSAELHFLRPGVYTLRVRAVDNAGNWGAQAERSIRIDNTAAKKPQIIEEKDEGDTLYVRWTKPEDLSGISNQSINVTLDDGTVFFYARFNSSATDFMVTGTGDDVYNVVVGVRNGAGLWSYSDQSDVESDSFPPVILQRLPSARAATLDPLVAIVTDEDSICSYNDTSSSRRNFTYTGSTRHETVVQAFAGTMHLLIRCSDSSGNTVEEEFSFQAATLLPDAGTAPSQALAYEGIEKGIGFSLRNSGNPISGVRDITFMLDGVPAEPAIHDYGDGRYEASFIFSENGTFPLTIASGTWTATVDVKVIPAMLEVRLVLPEDPTINVLRLLAYTDGGHTAGLAQSDERTTILATSDGMVMAGVSPVHMFYTRSFDPDDRESRLSSGSLGLFGYIYNGEDRNTYTLIYRNIFFNKDLSEGSLKGTKKLVLKVERKTEDRADVLISDKPDESREIIKYA